MPGLDVVSESTLAVALYGRHAWQVVGETWPPWLPPHRDPVLPMALPVDGDTVAPCRQH